MGCLAGVGVLAVLVAPVWGQETGANGGTSLSIFDHFLVKGGAITWFILVPLSVATLALTIEYCLSIRRKTFVPVETFDAIARHLEARDYATALQFTAEDPSVLARVVNIGLIESANGYPAMERSVEESLEEQASRAMRKIEYLNVIGNVSPMVGLFGTVYGMIRLFAAIREAGGIPEPARIADDISIALVTTFWGLLIAIPALSVFALFRNRIDMLTAECAMAADRLLAPFKPGSSVTPVTPGASSPSHPGPQTAGTPRVSAPNASPAEAG